MAEHGFYNFITVPFPITVPDSVPWITTSTTFHDTPTMKSHQAEPPVKHTQSEKTVARPFVQGPATTRQQTAAQHALSLSVTDFVRTQTGFYAESASTTLPSITSMLGRLDTNIRLIDIESIQALFESVMHRLEAKAVDFSLHFLSFAYKLYRLRDITDLFFAAFDFLRGVFSLEHLRSAIVHVHKFLRDAVRTLYNKLSSSPVFTTESSVVDGLKNLKARSSIVLGSELVTSIRDFILSLISFRLFPKDVAKKMTFALGPAKPVSAIGLVETSITAAIAILSSAERIRDGQSVSDVLTASDPLSAFITESQLMSTLQTLTYSGLPVEGRVCRTEYYTSLNKLCKDGEELEALMPRRHPQFVTLSTHLAKARLLRAAFTNKMSAESRQMPYCVALVGKPGIGKGTLIDYVGGLWSHVKGRKYDPSHVYHRQALEEYWSGYEPLSQPIIHYSEPGSLHKSIASKRGDPVMTEFLSVCDNQPYMCNMADVESKGNVFAMPEACVMDCNDASMNLQLIVNNPAAIRRRILYVEPTVKPEFRKEGTCRLDVARSLESESPVLDRWLFTVYKMEPKTSTESERINIAQGVDIFALTTVLKDLFEKHLKEQSARQSLCETMDVTDYLPTVITAEAAHVPINPFEYETDSEVTTPSQAAAVQAGVAYEEEMEDLLGPEWWNHESDEDQTDLDSGLTLDETDVEPLPFVESETSTAEVPLAFDQKVTMFFDKLYACPKDTRQMWILHKTMFVETFWGLGAVFVHCVALVALFCAMLVAYLSNNGMITKALTLRALRGRVDHRLARASHAWGYFLSSLGYETKAKVIPPPQHNYYAYIAAFTATLVIVKAMTATKYFLEGAMMSSSGDFTEENIDESIRKFEEAIESTMPQPRQKAGNGVDWTNAVAPAPVMIQHKNQKSPYHEIVNAVTANTRFVSITVKGSDIIRHSRVWGVCRDYALVNFHTLHAGASTWFFEVKRENADSTGIQRSIVRPVDICQVKGDIYIIRLRGTKFRDVQMYLAANLYEPRVFGTRGNFRGTEVIVKSMKAVKAIDANGTIDVLHPLYYPYPEHGPGLCGSPLISEFPEGAGVVGIHIAGTGGDLGISETISAPLVRSALKILSTSSNILNINSEGALRLPAYSKGLGAVSARSPLRFEEVPALVVYGSIEGYPPPKHGKSQLRSSAFLSVAEELTGVSPFCDGKPLFAAPTFTHKFVDGKHCSPFNYFVQKSGVQKMVLDPSRLERVISYLSEHVITELSARGIDTLEPVPLDVAINGHPKDFYMRAMKPSTSGGWAWPGAKKKYMEPVELDFKQDSLKLLWDVKEHVAEQLAAYSRDQDALPLLGAQLKDEPRSFEKVRLAKTRVFCMSPLESTVVNRMLLLPFYTLMVEHGDVFGSAIGINMHSTDVDDFVTDITSYSDLFMEGDYGGFDTSMPYDIGLAANSIVYEVLANKGYSESALQQVRGILSDNLYPTVVLKGEVFSAPALQPSGKYATAEDNSLRGLVMLVYAWFSMCEDQSCELDFFENVKPKVYGDDVVAAVKPAAQHFFHNVSYQAFCRTTYGIDYTNAQKTLTMSKFLKIDEISFLKRSFVYRDDLGHWVAPLERSSIMKSICYYLPSKQVTRDEQLIDSCTSALRELFFHTSEEDYEPLRRKFAHHCSEIFKRDQNDILKVFPRFDSILGQLYAAHCSDSEDYSV